jgi:hypothetical protein
MDTFLFTAEYIVLFSIISSYSTILLDYYSSSQVPGAHSRSTLSNGARPQTPLPESRAEYTPYVFCGQIGSDWCMRPPSASIIQLASQKYRMLASRLRLCTRECLDITSPFVLIPHSIHLLDTFDSIRRPPLSFPTLFVRRCLQGVSQCRLRWTRYLDDICMFSMSLVFAPLPYSRPIIVSSSPRTSLPSLLASSLAIVCSFNNTIA